MPSRSDVQFTTTPWTLIDELRRDACPLRLDQVLEDLSRTYWPCVFTYLRRCGYTADVADDLTQSFFADVVLGRRLFETADRTRGKLRTLMRSCLKRFCIDAARRRSVTGRNLEFRDDDTLERAGASGESMQDAEREYDRQWASVLLEVSLQRAEAHYIGSARAGHWHAYRRFVIEPCQYGSEPPAQPDLARELGFRDAASVASAIHVVKTRVQLMLRQVIREGVASDDEAAEEVAYIETLLGSG